MDSMITGDRFENLYNGRSVLVDQMKHLQAAQNLHHLTFRPLTPHYYPTLIKGQFQTIMLKKLYCNIKEWLENMNKSEWKNRNTKK